MQTVLHKVHWYAINPTFMFSLWMVHSWSLLVSSTLTIALSSLLSNDHIKINFVGWIKSLMSHQILFSNYIKFKLLLHNLTPILSLKFPRKTYQHVKSSISPLRELGTHLQHNLLMAYWTRFKYLSITSYISLSIVLNCYIFLISSKWTRHISVVCKFIKLLCIFVCFCIAARNWKSCYCSPSKGNWSIKSVHDFINKAVDKVKAS
jgi:hypothetical protein